MWTTMRRGSRRKGRGAAGEGRGAIDDDSGEAKEAKETREESRTRKHFVRHLSIGRADPQDGRRKIEV
jgi:hypothetical protein